MIIVNYVTIECNMLIHISKEASKMFSLVLCISLIYSVGPQYVHYRRDYAFVPVHPIQRIKQAPILRKPFNRRVKQSRSMTVCEECRELPNMYNKIRSTHFKSLSSYTM